MASLTNRASTVQARTHPRPTGQRRPAILPKRSRNLSARATITTEEAAPSLDIHKGVIAPGGVCVVTGGSRGIGKEIALALAAAGQCKVVVNHIPQEKELAEEVAHTIVHTLGADAICVEGNVTKQDEMSALMKTTVDKWGQIDVLVNNAGITRDGLITTMKPEQWQAVIDTNLTGAFYAAQAALKVMGRARKGRIINVASVVGVMGNAGQANYASAKAGIIGLTKTIAAEYAGRNILCNAIAPGYIQTAMTDKLDEKVKAAIVSHVPLGRMGQPSEVAGLVRYLALDPSAAYITGHVVLIDGGMFML